MDDFHRFASAEERIRIVRNIKDDRFRLFAERLICQMYPNNAPEDMLNRYQELTISRLREKGPWGCLESAIDETNTLLQGDIKDTDKEILLQTKEYYFSLPKE